MIATILTLTSFIFSAEPTVVEGITSDPVIVSQFSDLIRTLVLGVLGLLGAVLTALITIGSKKLLAWLDAKSKESGSAAHYAAFRCATEKLTTLSTNAVTEVEQTLVRKLKREGNWNAATARMARDTAVEIMKRHAGEQGMAEMQDCLGLARTALLGMFRTYVERVVASMGTTDNASPVVAMGVGTDAQDIDSNNG